MASPSNLKLIYRSNEHYPDPQPESVRRYRLWDPKANAYIPGRCYSIEKHAYDGALSYMKWYLPIGQAVEILDVSKANCWLATYKKTVDGHKEQQLVKDSAILARSQQQ